MPVTGAKMTAFQAEGTARQSPNVTAILLAAGRSRRFGPDDKLMAELDGTPIILKTLNALTESRCQAVHVIVAPDNRPLIELLKGQPVTIVPNPQAHAGLGNSIATGIASLADEVTGALILPGDMPWMTSAFINRLVEAFGAENGQKVTVPITIEGEQRNPIIWPRSDFAELRDLSGDRGAKKLIPSDPAQRLEVPAQDAGIFQDIDTHSDLNP